jgi:hypothetical protein
VALLVTTARRLSSFVAGGQHRAEALFLYNLLRTKAEAKILPAGMGFALSWRGDRTQVVLTRRQRRETCNHNIREEGS